jgi:hypothetical protein
LRGLNSGHHLRAFSLKKMAQKPALKSDLAAAIQNSANSEISRKGAKAQRNFSKRQMNRTIKTQQIIVVPVFFAPSRLCVSLYPITMLQRHLGGRIMRQNSPERGNFSTNPSIELRDL